MFEWHVENSVVTELKPFGVVSRKGTKEVKIGGFNISQGLLVKLCVSNEDITLERELIIERKIEQPIHETIVKPKAHTKYFPVMALGVLLFIVAIFIYSFKNTTALPPSYGSNEVDSSLASMTKTDSSNSTNYSLSKVIEGKPTSVYKERSGTIKEKVTSKSEEET